jgi:hypothetical protein
MGELKKRRFLLLAALLVLIISAVSLHVVGGVFLMKAGLGMFSFRNPIALVLIGLPWSSACSSSNKSSACFIGRGKRKAAPKSPASSTGMRRTLMVLSTLTASSLVW